MNRSQDSKKEKFNRKHEQRHLCSCISVSTYYDIVKTRVQATCPFSCIGDTVGLCVSGRRFVSRNKGPFYRSCTNGPVRSCTPP